MPRRWRVHFRGGLLSEWASNLEADRMARISNTVRQGFLLGDTQEQIAKRSVDMLTAATGMVRFR